MNKIEYQELIAFHPGYYVKDYIDEQGITQEELAKRIGKSREYVANMLRLLKLPPVVQTHVVNQELSMGHVRALLGLKDEKLMEEVAQKAIQLHLSVRAVETMVKNINEPKEKPETKPKDIHLGQVENRLQTRFQTKVKVDANHISIAYNGNDDLNRLLELLGGLDEELQLF